LPDRVENGPQLAKKYQIDRPTFVVEALAEAGGETEAIWSFPPFTASVDLGPLIETIPDPVTI